MHPFFTFTEQQSESVILYNSDFRYFEQLLCITSLLRTVTLHNFVTLNSYFAQLRYFEQLLSY